MAFHAKLQDVKWSLTKNHTFPIRAVAAYEANEAEASLDFQTFFEGPPNFLGATKIFGGHQNILGLEKA